MQLGIAILWFAFPAAAVAGATDPVPQHDCGDCSKNPYRWVVASNEPGDTLFAVTRVAEDDTYVLDSGGALRIPVPGVLANDAVDRGDLTVRLVDPPREGPLVLRPDGSFDYTPSAEFEGVDTFAYTTSAPASNIAVVHIEVKRAVAASLNGRADQFEVHGTSLRVPAPGVIANDEYSGEGTAEVHLVTNASQGKVDLSPSGAFLYEPNPQFAGVDEFTYKLSDGTRESEPVTVTLVARSEAEARAPVGTQAPAEAQAPADAQAPPEAQLPAGVQARAKAETPTPVQAPAGIAPRSGWSVVLGAFRIEQNAVRAYEQYRDAGYGVSVHRIERRGKTWHQVEIPGIADREEALRIGASMERVLGLKGVWIDNAR